MSDLDIAEGMSDIAALQQARRRFGALNGYRPPQRKLVAPTAGLLGKLEPSPWQRPAELTTYASTMDPKGRCALRKPAEALGWHPGSLMQIVAGGDGAVSVQASADASGVKLDSRMRLRLPLDVRLSAGLTTGDAIYIVCDPDSRRLRLLGPAAALRLAA